MNYYYQMYWEQMNDIITKDLEASVDKKLLLKALHQLSDREKQIMELRFGLGTGEEKTQKDVADMLGFLNPIFLD